MNNHTLNKYFDALMDSCNSNPIEFVVASYIHKDASDNGIADYGIFEIRNYLVSMCGCVSSVRDLAHTMMHTKPNNPIYGIVVGMHDYLYGEFVHKSEVQVEAASALMDADIQLDKFEFACLAKQLDVMCDYYSRHNNFTVAELVHAFCMDELECPTMPLHKEEGMDI